MWSGEQLVEIGAVIGQRVGIPAAQSGRGSGKVRHERRFSAGLAPMRHWARKGASVRSAAAPAAAAPPSPACRVLEGHDAREIEI